ncbi:hypothetical protein, partial [Enterovibrio norvegicus]|uniref:hypothetical protein n=1 Tax=Enterovibrio norvegicus TaxID=188144 RepID=UPI001C616AF6
KGNENQSINAKHSGKNHLNVVSLRETTRAVWLDVRGASIYVPFVPLSVLVSVMFKESPYMPICRGNG